MFLFKSKNKAKNVNEFRKKNEILFLINAIVFLDKNK